MSGFLFSYMYCNWHRNKTHKVASAPAVKLSVLNAEIQIIFGTVHAGKRPEEMVYYEKQNKILEGSVILFFDNLFYKVIKGV